MGIEGGISSYRGSGNEIGTVEIEIDVGADGVDRSIGGCAIKAEAGKAAIVLAHMGAVDGIERKQPGVGAEGDAARHHETQ